MIHFCFSPSIVFFVCFFFQSRQTISIEEEVAKMSFVGVLSAINMKRKNILHFSRKYKLKWLALGGLVYYGYNYVQEPSTHHKLTRYALQNYGYFTGTNVEIGEMEGKFGFGEAEHLICRGISVKNETKGVDIQLQRLEMDTVWFDFLFRFTTPLKGLTIENLSGKCTLPPPKHFYYLKKRGMHFRTSYLEMANVNLSFYTQDGNHLTDLHVENFESGPSGFRNNHLLFFDILNSTTDGTLNGHKFKVKTKLFNEKDETLIYSERYIPSIPWQLLSATGIRILGPINYLESGTIGINSMVETRPTGPETMAEIKDRIMKARVYLKRSKTMSLQTTEQGELLDHTRAVRMYRNILWKKFMKKYGLKNKSGWRYYYTLASDYAKDPEFIPARGVSDIWDEETVKRVQDFRITILAEQMRLQELIKESTLKARPRIYEMFEEELVGPVGLDAPRHK